MLTGQTSARHPVTRDHALLALAADALHGLMPVSLVLAFTVDDCGVLEHTAAIRGRPATGRDPERVVELLRRLEPIDPFSPRRAQASRAVVMSACDIGGANRFAGLIYGGHLLEHGYACPLFVYLRREGAIVAGIGLLRELTAPTFSPADVLLVRRFAPLLEQSLVIAGAGGVPERGAARLVADGLTAREREVAGLVAHGSSNADIARALTMSQATVKTHLTKIYAKLGVRTRTQLAVLLGAGGSTAHA
jgi:DNA-binding CsgD family transcriptional regulator